jgi:hypothetical protein
LRLEGKKASARADEALPLHGTAERSADAAARYRQAWDTGRAHFGSRVHFYAPSIKRYETEGFRNSRQPRFIPVSITGSACQLKCEHCRSRILETMHAARSPEELIELGRRLKEKGGEGLLISGGSREDGSVPLLEYAGALRSLKQLGFTIAVHTGLVDRELGAALADAGIDIAMLDILGADETIREVYHLDATITDFEESLALLCQSGVRTAPHVVIGLHFGRIAGELQALELIARHDITALVLVVLTPQPGTPMQAVTPPSPEEAGEIFVAAREMFPQVPILLGCARPYGDHKRRTDELALRAGLNGIAYPAEGIVESARQMGLEPVFSEQCCSLIYQSEGERKNDGNLASARHGREDRG